MSQSKHLLSQSKTDELVSAGLQEVLDVFLPAGNPHSQIS